MDQEPIPPPELSYSSEDSDDYILLGEVARELGRQTQYTSYYLTGLAGYPNLGEGLDFIEGSGGNYHATAIKKSDAEELKRRILEYSSWER